MKARAPGKIVISGAYAVLETAPAIVSALDRFVTADTDRAASHVSPEVRCAIGADPAPFVDASELRMDGRKLGLGSSAAILVASLAALTFQEDPTLSNLDVAERVWPRAVEAHREAQGGGSGIDVITSALGGTRRCWLEGDTLRSEEVNLVEAIHIDLYAEQTSSSTASMLEKVLALKHRHPDAYFAQMNPLVEAARRTASMTSADSLLNGLHEQMLLLAELGRRAAVPIVPDHLERLAREAWRDEVVVMPSGAGGGDIVLCVGDQGACSSWRSRLEASGLQRLEVSLGALGVHKAL